MTKADHDAPVTTYYRGDGITLYTGNAAAGIATIPDTSVDCLVTSPPYWRLRDYTPLACDPHDDPISSRAGRSHLLGRAGRPSIEQQIGQEDTAEDYVTALRDVFHHARRILTRRATVWINLGDNYSANSDGYRCRRPGRGHQPSYRPPADVAHKNLLGMPWRVAFALQDDGWILRSAIVWHKPNAAPTQARDRLASRHETIFHFVSQPDYHFDLDPIREPYTGDRALSRRAHRRGRKPNTVQGAWPRTAADGSRGRNPGNVWTIQPERARTGHPAGAPLDVPLRCIAAGCPEGGTVLDPFSGAATTGVAARQLGRSYIGIDLRSEFHRIALRRLHPDTGDQESAA